MTESAQRLVFTDLDGTLLDHDSYSYAAAMPCLRTLERLGIPLIPATSKTRAEIEQLRAELGNAHPFVVENGAAVFIPAGYFPAQPAETTQRGDYWVRELAPGRPRWLALLDEVQAEFAGEFAHFFQLGTTGIMRATGLTESRARLANQREYSEPVQWLGRESRKRAFVAELQRRGATVLQGGRFLSVSGDTDKGRALRWLRQCYADVCAGGVDDLAAGDSDNDCAMLEVAATALVVRSPARPLPKLARQVGVLHSKACGPAGWAEGVRAWLQGEAKVSE